MHYRSLYSPKLSTWVVVATAIYAANLLGDTTPDVSTPRFAVENRGVPTGRPIMFIPGLATPGTVWDATAENFIDYSDIHIVTLAGFGELPAADPIGPFIELAVTALTDYLDDTQLRDAVLVGHSIGAQIALQLAAARPDVVSQVLVVDSAPFYAALFNPAITPQAARAYGTNLASQMAATPREQFLAFARQGIGVQSISKPGQEQVMGYMSASDQATVALAMAEVTGSDFRPGLVDVHAPVTVLAAWSEGVPYSSEKLLSIYQNQYAGLESVEVHIISGSRHFIMLDQPDAFADALNRMLTLDYNRSEG